MRVGGDAGDGSADGNSFLLGLDGEVERPVRGRGGERFPCGDGEDDLRRLATFPAVTGASDVIFLKATGTPQWDRLRNDILDFWTGKDATLTPLTHFHSPAAFADFLRNRFLLSPSLTVAHSWPSAHSAENALVEEVFSFASRHSFARAHVGSNGSAPLGVALSAAAEAILQLRKDLDVEFLRLTAEREAQARKVNVFEMKMEEHRRKSAPHVFQNGDSANLNVGLGVGNGFGSLALNESKRLILKLQTLRVNMPYLLGEQLISRGSERLTDLFAVDTTLSFNATGSEAASLPDERTKAVHFTCGATLVKTFSEADMGLQRESPIAGEERQFSIYSVDSLRAVPIGKLAGTRLLLKLRVCLPGASATVGGPSASAAAADTGSETGRETEIGIGEWMLDDPLLGLSDMRVRDSRSLPPFDLLLPTTGDKLGDVTLKIQYVHSTVAFHAEALTQARRRLDQITANVKAVQEKALVMETIAFGRPRTSLSPAPSLILSYLKHPHELVAKFFPSDRKTNPSEQSSLPMKLQALLERFLHFFARDVSSGGYTVLRDSGEGDMTHPQFRKSGLKGFSGERNLTDFLGRRTQLAFTLWIVFCLLITCLLSLDRSRDLDLILYVYAAFKISQPCKRGDLFSLMALGFATGLFDLLWLYLNLSFFSRPVRPFLSLQLDKVATCAALAGKAVFILLNWHSSRTLQ